MKNALIDIGSNTIRLVIYCGRDEIFNVAEYAGLIGDVSNGVISPSGVMKIINTLSKMKNKCIQMGCDNVYAFATASLRHVKDKEALIDTIYDAVGIKVEIITGEDEAYYDYIGLQSVNNITKGIAFDLGGGSCQLISFANNAVTESMSFPIGSLKLKTQFVSNTLPDLHEQEKIYDYVKGYISTLKTFLHTEEEKLYAMGGAAFALLELLKRYYNKNLNAYGKAELDFICTLSEEQITAVVPRRLETVIPAAITMGCIINCTGAKYIVPTPAGVRDGIIAKKFFE